VLAHGAGLAGGALLGFALAPHGDALEGGLARDLAELGLAHDAVRAEVGGLVPDVAHAVHALQGGTAAAACGGSTPASSASARTTRPTSAIARSLPVQSGIHPPLGRRRRTTATRNPGVSASRTW